MQNRILAIIALGMFLSVGLSAADSPYVNGFVNGKPIKLKINTSTQYSKLSESAAKRVDLNWSMKKAVVNGRDVSVKISDDCALVVNGNSTPSNYKFLIVKTAQFKKSKFDGEIGWNDIKSSVFSIGGPDNRIVFLKSLPEKIESWNKWTLSPRQDMVAFHVGLKNNGEPAAVVVSTSSRLGVEVSDWEKWHGKYVNEPHSLRADYLPHKGMKVYKEYWSKKVEYNEFRINDVPVTESVSGFNEVYEDCVLTLGMFALRRMSMIVDGKNKIVYTKLLPVNNQLVYPHSRIGAVFAPKTIRDSDNIANVVEGGPAYNAGIRNGDVLLAIGELDVTKWKTDPNVLPLSRFWEKLAGTKLYLKIKKKGNGAVETVEIVLQDILLSNGDLDENRDTQLFYKKRISKDVPDGEFVVKYKGRETVLTKTAAYSGEAKLFASGSAVCYVERIDSDNNGEIDFMDETNVVISEIDDGELRPIKRFNGGVIMDVNPIVDRVIVVKKIDKKYSMISYDLNTKKESHIFEKVEWIGYPKHKMDGKMFSFYISSKKYRLNNQLIIFHNETGEREVISVNVGTSHVSQWVGDNLIYEMQISAKPERQGGKNIRVSFNVSGSNYTILSD